MTLGWLTFFDLSNCIIFKLSKMNLKQIQSVAQGEAIPFVRDRPTTEGEPSKYFVYFDNAHRIRYSTHEDHIGILNGDNIAFNIGKRESNNEKLTKEERMYLNVVLFPAKEGAADVVMVNTVGKHEPAPQTADVEPVEALEAS